MNSLTVRPASLPSHGGTLNPYTAVAQEMSSGVGTLLKFAKGRYQTRNDEVPLETEFVAHVTQITRAWIKFSGNQIVDRLMYRVADGAQPPPRNTLGDTDESLWAPDPRNPRDRQDPWSHQWYLPLTPQEYGEALIFVTQSTGGIGAIGRLCAAYGQRYDQGLRGMPIIQLATDKYKHKAFGEVVTPEFKVMGWQGENAILPPEPSYSEAKPADDMTDEVPF